MQLINLTPHAVNVYDACGEMLFSLPPSGQVARVPSEIKWSRDEGPSERRAWYYQGVPFAVRDLDITRTENLPPESDFGTDGMPITGYVVSLITWMAIRNQERIDIFTPGPEIRDSDGRIIGCEGLVWDWAPNRLGQPLDVIPE